MAVAVAFTATLASTAQASATWTFNTVAIGTAAADRLIFVVVQSTTTGAVTTSVTVGGVSATEVTGAASTSIARKTQIWWAAVPSGTTATIVIVNGSNGGSDSVGGAVYSVTGADTTTPIPVSNSTSATTRSSGNSITATLDVPANGGAIIGIWGTGTRGVMTSTWTNATEVQDTSNQSAASYTTASLQSARLFTDTFSGTISLMSLSAVSIQVPAAGGAYSLIAASGSYALTGQTVTTKAARLTTAVAGAYTLTGTAATLNLGKRTTAVAGSYAITGTAAALRLDRRNSAASGSYVFTGTTATLRRNLPLTAGAGSYAISGSAVAALHKALVTAGAGSYAISGSAAALKLARRVAAAGGSYTVNGSDVTLTHGALGAFTITAQGAAYLLSGGNATLLHQWLASALSGAYAINGTSVALVPGSVAPPTDVDTHDGLPWHDYAEDRTREDRARREHLRSVVERAYRNITDPEVPAPVQVTKREQTRIARAILPEVNAAGLEASLREVLALLADVQMAHEAERRRAAFLKTEEEAMIVLLLS